MKLFKTLFISFTFLLLCSAGVMAANPTILPSVQYINKDGEVATATERYPDYK